MTKKFTTSKRGKFGALVLTDEQEAWLQKHFKHTKNEEIAERFGISPRSVTRLARKRGLKKSQQFLTKVQLDAAAAANRSHLINGTYPPKGYRIPRGEEFWFKKGETNVDRFGVEKNAERIAKCAQSRRETYRLEKARALYGLPRQTKLQVVQRPRKQVWTRYYLRKRGYVVERGSNVAYYNSETQRSLKMETNPPAGFSFLEQS